MNIVFKIILCRFALFSFALTALLSISPLSAGELPGEGKTVIPVDDQMIEGMFQTRVLTIALEKLGYEIDDIQHLTVPAGMTAISQGEGHFTACNWTPNQQGVYEKAGGDETMQQVGVIVRNATQGYLIDMKTAEKYNITNIERMKDPEISALFDTDNDGKANLAGCPPGWGCETVINHHIKAYGLEDSVEHDQGDFSVLASDVLARFREGKPVFYYTYTPLWFSEYVAPGKDARWLEVPHTDLPSGLTGDEVNTKLPDGRNVGFGLQNIMTTANKAWLEENPAAHRLLEVAELPITAVNAQNRRVYEGEKKRNRYL